MALPQKPGGFIEQPKEVIEKSYKASGNPAPNEDLDLYEIGCDLNDKTEDVAISMVEVGMMLMILMNTMIITMPWCKRWQLINNSNMIKLLKVIRECQNISVLSHH